MKSLRAKRTAQVLHQEIAYFIHQEIEEIDKTGLISITKVTISDNLKSAKIYISILGGKVMDSKVLTRIQQMQWDMRKKLRKTLTTRYFPELFFTLDQSIRHTHHIRQALSERE